ncbi:MAG: acyl-CoA/acyl-ACP dehydrogenase [Proteobacteria bacterium]|nr:acyl-CoA/acyl-ACP dehydrogenase [Pseudomonadota bacterium]
MECIELNEKIQDFSTPNQLNKNKKEIIFKKNSIVLSSIINKIITDRNIYQALLTTKNQLDQENEYSGPVRWRKLMVSSGITRLDLPTRVGGLNWSNEKMAEVFAMCGIIDLNLRDVPGGGHGKLLLHIRSRKFDEILTRLSNSDEFIGIAITEEKGGSDLHGLSTRAIPVRDGYIIQGEKMHVARLQESTYFVVFAVVQRNFEGQKLTAFLVPVNTSGIHHENLDTMGFHGVSWGKLIFQNVFIPSHMRIGGEGEGFSLFAKHFSYWRCAMAAAAIGCAEGAINQTITWLKERHAFGGPIGRFTHLQQELAYHYSQLKMAWLLVLDAMKNMDNKQSSLINASMAKAETLEIAISAVNWSMRVHAAKAYSTALDLEKRLRDLLGLRIADGVTDVLRGQVARNLLGEDIYEMSLNRQG